MTITCPLCHQVCETDSEIEVGQRVQCPFCDGKFTYGEDAHEGHCHSQKSKIKIFCHQCGAMIEVDAKYVGREAICPHCNTSIIVQDPGSAHREPGTIDISKDRFASLARWLRAINTLLFMSFGGDIFVLLGDSISLYTIAASGMCLAACFVLTKDISKGFCWARISTYLYSAISSIFFISSPISKAGVFSWICLCSWLSLIMLILAAAFLLLPNVSGKLKELGKGVDSGKKRCLLFWGLFIGASILCALAPDNEGFIEFTKRYNINLFYVPMALGFAGVAIGKVATLLFGDDKKDAKVDTIAITDYSSSKWRTRNCPKCGHEIRVPDTDDNEMVHCNHCEHAFYPFGRSKIAIISFWLGLVSLCFWFFGPIAFFLGRKALKDIKENRGAHGITRAWIGIITGAVGSFMLIFLLVGYLVG